MDWDTYFLNAAYLAALKSKDRSTQVGAVIVGPDREIRSTGLHGPPRGMDDADDAIHAKPAKYLYFEHAERNALYHSCRIGVPVKGCTLYVTNDSCADCARGIVQAGITEVVVHAEAPPMTGWTDSQEAARDIFRRCGVRVRRWSCSPVLPGIRHGGAWIPLASAPAEG